MNNTHGKHYPAEIFGFPVDNQSKEAENIRKNHLCPFNNNNRCSKQGRLLTYPMGICSVWWPNNSPIAICPNRLLQNKTTFVDGAKHVFGGINNILLFSEIRLKQIGAFDFVLVKHKPISDEIKDFCVVEFQSDSTTGTGKLVEAMQDYVQGEDITKKSYAFGMNTYNTIKLSYIQMLFKGQVFEAWNKKIIWAVQRYVYKNMVDRFGLEDMELNKKDAILFFIYDIDYSSNPKRYQLILQEIKSSKVENLLKAFQSKSLPKIDDFVRVLYQKLRLNLATKI